MSDDRAYFDKVDEYSELRSEYDKLRASHQRLLLACKGVLSSTWVRGTPHTLEAHAAIAEAEAIK